MTGRYGDGFEWLPTGQSSGTVERLLNASHYYMRRDLSGGTPSVAAPGRFGFGKCLQVSGFTSTGSGGYHVVRPIDPEGGLVVQTGFLGLALYVATGSDAVGQWIGLYDAVSDFPQVSMQICPNGVLRAWRGYPNSGAFLGSTSAGALTWDAWARIEVGSKIDASAGTFELRVNTKPVINLVSQNTKATGVAGFDSFAFGCMSQGGVGASWNYYLDDLTVNDDQGTVNNSFLGNVRVKSQFGVGPGAVSAFTPTGAATDWQAMLNLLADDSVYAAGASAGDEAMVAIEAILGSQAVHWAQVRSAMRQDDATQRTGRNLFQLSGGTRTELGNHLTDQTFTYYTDIQELDPDTGLGLTGTQMNAAQIGPKVQV